MISTYAAANAVDGGVPSRNGVFAQASFRRPAVQQGVRGRKGRQQRGSVQDVQAATDAGFRLQDGEAAGGAAEQAGDAGRQGHRRDPVWPPTWSHQSGHPGGPPVAALLSHRAAGAHVGAPAGDGVRAGEAGAGERDADAAAEGGRGVRLGRLLQRPQGRLRHPPEGGLRRRPPRDGATAGGVHGRRRLAGVLHRERRGGGRRADVHEGKVRAGGGVQGLRVLLHDQPRRRRRRRAQHLPRQVEVIVL